MTPSLVILLHSSKTMRSLPQTPPLQQPQLLEKAQELNRYLKTLPTEQLVKCMHISPQLAEKTRLLIADWSDDPDKQTRAIDSFIGDIYSGLQAGELSKSDRDYANTTLWILSGLYGFLRPYDGICPYRLEMGYKFPNAHFANLYTFWGNSIAKQLPENALIINVSSIEYTNVITPFVEPSRIVTPNFLTLDAATGIPTFKTVHAKIARGAFARWLITSRTTDPKKFKEFSDLGYHFDSKLSTVSKPTFVCNTFGGVGLSIRLA